MEGFTRALAQEVGSRSITVNAVAPGFIETDMTHQLSEDVQQQMLSRIPLGRMGSVEDVAHVVAFLARRCGSVHHGGDHSCQWWLAHALTGRSFVLE
jgi:NAD(P)-dependent dehydrogenase (short-subunit alcohol dehydrogenase family)